MADIQDFWTWFKAVKPEWFTAAAAVVGAVAAVVGAVVVVLRLFRRYVLRRELRGSGAAIIALLGEPQHEARMDSKGRGELGWIKYTSEVVYIRVGTDYYLLCSRDLDRLHSLGVCAAGNFRPNMKGVVQFITTTYSGRSSPKSFHGADS